MVIGPRIGKFVGGKPQALPGPRRADGRASARSSSRSGWFGFNPGSTLAGTDLRISFVVVNTMLAGVTGALAAHLALNAKGLKPDVTMLCNGMLAGSLPSRHHARS
jgi:Amt family ammonium transporter